MPFESQILHCFVRTFAPARIIEIGSGVATACMLHAAQVNRSEGRPVSSITCIEPFPSGALSGRNEITLVRQDCQTASHSIFSQSCRRATWHACIASIPGAGTPCGIAASRFPTPTPAAKTDAILPAVVTRDNPCQCRTHAFPLVLVTLFLFLAIFFREQDTVDGPASFLYSTRIGDFTLMDLMFLALAGLFVLNAFARRTAFGHPVLFPQGLHGPIALLGVTTFFAFMRAYYAGYEEIFHDWKNWLLGVVFFCICYEAAIARRHLRTLFYVFLGFCWVRAVLALILYVSGRGMTTYVEGYIPLYDGPTLHFLTAAALLTWALYVLGHGSPWLLLAGLAPLACVILSLRRTFWGTLALGVLITLYQADQVVRRKHLRTLILVLAVLAPLLIQFPTTLAILETLAARARSMYVFAETPEPKHPFYATNQSHVDDVLGAWDTIRAQPILGFGIGRPYSTPRLRGWKTESWGVHNGPMNHWLKFGLLGFIGYLWFHFRIWTRMRQVQGRLQSWNRAVLVGASSFPLGLFLVSCTFSPGPYESFRSVILVFFLLGIWSALTAAARRAAKSPGRVAVATAGDSWQIPRRAIAGS